MKYITITSKHHDGFAMWGTKQGKWNIVDATPYKKDPLKKLSAVRVSPPDARPPATSTAISIYMDARLKELLSGYGEIGGIWFDGWWDKPAASWRLEKTYNPIHSLQPATLVGNNHHRKPFDGEDFQMFEKDLPGQNTAGFNKDSEIGKLPLESCDTINKAWGYNTKDKQFKSAKDLIHFPARAARHNSNFLLNAGPTPEGTIQPEFVERLRAIGGWLGKNGESLYGTRGGPT